MERIFVSKGNGTAWKEKNGQPDLSKQVDFNPELYQKWGENALFVIYIKKTA